MRWGQWSSPTLSSLHFDILAEFFHLHLGLSAAQKHHVLVIVERVEHWVVVVFIPTSKFFWRGASVPGIWLLLTGAVTSSSSGPSSTTSSASEAAHD